TSIFAPPDGSMADYMESLDRLINREDRLLLPGKKAGFFGAILAISSDVLLFPLRALLAGRYR
ncbi:hypothetical protein ACC730_37480, partial [Rhizobium ruizarguesonis]